MTALAAAGVFYAFAQRWPLALVGASFCIALNWFGDSLDGTVARVRGRLRPRYGFYVDHVVDAFGALFVLGGLARSGYVTPSVAIVLLVVYLLFSIEVFLAAHTVGTFRLSYGKVSPTELRLLLIVGNCFAYGRPRVIVFGTELPFFDIGLAIASVVMTIVLVVSVARHTRELYVAERL